jgi:hypothetical protein
VDICHADVKFCWCQMWKEKNVKCLYGCWNQSKVAWKILKILLLRTTKWYLCISKRKMSKMVLSYHCQISPLCNGSKLRSCDQRRLNQAASWEPRQACPSNSSSSLQDPLEGAGDLAWCSVFHSPGGLEFG